MVTADYCIQSGMPATAIGEAITDMMRKLEFPNMEVRELSLAIFWVQGGEIVEHPEDGEEDEDDDIHVIDVPGEQPHGSAVQLSTVTYCDRYGFCLLRLIYCYLFTLVILLFLF